MPQLQDSYFAMLLSGERNVSVLSMVSKHVSTLCICIVSDGSAARDSGLKREVASTRSLASFSQASNI